MLGKDYASGKANWITLSSGDRRFRHDGLIVRPMLVLLDSKRRRLAIVERAISSDPRESTKIDRTSARITALVVVRSLRKTLPSRATVALYLSYPGNVQREIDAQLRQTAKIIGEHRERQRQWVRSLASRTHPEAIPGQVLAYTLSMIPEVDSDRRGRSHG